MKKYTIELTEDNINVILQSLNKAEAEKKQLNKNLERNFRSDSTVAQEQKNRNNEYIKRVNKAIEMIVKQVEL